jgi:hypothetical protein
MRTKADGKTAYRPVGQRLALGAMQSAYATGGGAFGGVIVRCGLARPHANYMNLTLSFNTGGRKLKVGSYNRTNPALSVGKWCSQPLNSTCCFDRDSSSLFARGLFGRGLVGRGDCPIEVPARTCTTRVEIWCSVYHVVEILLQCHRCHACGTSRVQVRIVQSRQLGLLSGGAGRRVKPLQRAGHAAVSGCSLTPHENSL